MCVFLCLPLPSNRETRRVFVLCVYHLTCRAGRRQRSTDAVSQRSDYISSLTAMALSAEGMHWPTLVCYITPFSLRVHFPSINGICMWKVSRGAFTQTAGLCNLGYLSALIASLIYWHWPLQCLLLDCGSVMLNVP